MLWNDISIAKLSRLIRSIRFGSATEIALLVVDDLAGL